MSQQHDTESSLTGRVIMISGASSGLGEHFAALLDACGARLAVAARRIDSLMKLSCVAEGRAMAIAMDVTDRGAVAEAIDQIGDRFGRIDGLVNNAGIAWGGRARDMPGAAWDRVIATNLTGAFTVAQAVAPVMAAGGGGAIVSTASILGLRTGAGLAAYAASKAGLVHLTKSLALEWARDNIRVNAIAPGYIPTDLNRAHLESAEGERMRRAIPLRRFGRPEDLDAPLKLLLSDAGSYITGVTLPVDGGHLCTPL